nr:ribonuclease HII [Saprospiraceae bacterium]
MELEAGCDEAGRGCLAGAVVAAAVILNPGAAHSLIRDSKTLNAKDREEAAAWIKAEAHSWAVSFVTPEEIDRINILQASILAMNNAVAQLPVQPDFLLIDGNRFSTPSGLPFACIVKGDQKIASISAASILAKTERDRYMFELHQKYPQYHWDKNKGYPTRTHRASLTKWGVSPFHRNSFKLLRD